MPNCNPYQITLERQRNPAVGESITFILIANGRPRPLADGAVTVIESDQTCFEIPVFISKNTRTKFEGILTGNADGRDIRIVWNADPKEKTLGVIVESTNESVTFVEKPGATRW